MKKILSLLLLFICAASVTLAQELREFSVTGFVEKPFDTSARDERYKIIDGNGEYFSIIKLVALTPDDDLRAYAFDFGLWPLRKPYKGGRRRGVGLCAAQRNALYNKARWFQDREI